MLNKKRDGENRTLEEQPHLTKTQGRFETFTGKNNELISVFIASK